MPTTIVLVLLLFMLVASALEWLAVDVVALTLLAALLVTGQISLAEGISGFSDTAVITVLFMMILSEAVTDSGLIAQVGHRISRIAGGSWGRSVALLLVVCGGLSMFINNTAAIAMFLPVAIQIAKQHRKGPSKLLLPLNYAAVIGGTCTLVGTSTNILVSSLAEARGLPAIAMFELFPMGIVFFACGMLYNVLLVRYLPERGDASSLTSKYQLTTFLTEVKVPAASRLVGRTVVEEKISDRYHLNVLEILRGTRKIAFDLRNTPLAPEDILIVRGTMADIVQFKEQQQLLLLSDIKLSDANLSDEDNVLAEMQLSPSSTLEGTSLREIDFRRRFGAFVLALSRTGELIREKLVAHSAQALGHAARLRPPPQRRAALQARRLPAAAGGRSAPATASPLVAACRGAGRDGRRRDLLRRAAAQGGPGGDRRPAGDPGGAHPARLPFGQLVGLLPARGDSAAGNRGRASRPREARSETGSPSRAAASGRGRHSPCSISSPWC